MVDSLIKNLPSQSGYVQLGNTKQWEDDFLSEDTEVNASVRSTFSPPVLMEAAQNLGASATSTILTLSLVILAVILAIAALFALAFFIDYRQHKMSQQNKINNSLKRRKKYPRMNLPRCRRARDDTTQITSNAEEPGISRPPLETIMEDV